MDKANIGRKLRALRGTKTMAEVAEAVGTSVSAIAMYESGERIPRDEIKIALAKYYGVAVETIFFETD